MRRFLAPFVLVLCATPLAACGEGSDDGADGGIALDEPTDPEAWRASAEVTCKTYTAAQRETDYARTIAVQGFDADLGELMEAEFTMTSTLSVDVGAENWTGVAGTVSTDAAADLEIAFDGTTLAVGSVDATHAHDLGAADGDNDFDGEGGDRWTVTGSATGEPTGTQDVSLLAELATGTFVELEVAGVGSTQVSFDKGAWAHSALTHAGAEIQVCLRYVPGA